MTVEQSLNGKTRDEAWALLTEFIQSESLRRHCLSVETAMRAYAGHYDESEEAWGLVGLIHDFDYERYPDLSEHTFRGAEVLEEHGYPAWVVRAVRSHNPATGVQRESHLEKALFAVDELTGFISAVALVRPSKAVRDVKVSSVKKKMKDRGFAQGVNRAEMTEGAEALGVDFDEHIGFVIQAMAANADELGLGGAEPTS